MSPRVFVSVFAVVSALAIGVSARADDVLHIGEAFADPGEINIGYRLMISGDQNLNARCTVRFRKVGEPTWKPALDAWRFHPWITPSEDSIGGVSNVIDKAENRFAGSIFWVEPGETYEIELTLTDPDGVTGTNPVILVTTTWTELVPNPNGRKLYVVPGSGGGSGTIDDPFRGLPAAHAAAQPGDIIYVASGVYPAFTITKNGTPGNPICWIGPPDQSAVIDAGGGSRALQLSDLSNPLRYVIIERFTLRNASDGIYASRVQHTKVRHCKIIDITDDGYFNSSQGIEFRQAVMDCTIIGDEPWISDYIGSSEGIEIQGTAAIVAHNYVEGFADCISVDPRSSTRTSPYGEDNNCYDVYGNYITKAGDDGIELDHIVTGCRAWRNVVMNCRMGFTNQPLFGGPCYIFRNEIFYLQDNGPGVRTGSAYKLHNGASGTVLIHNTSSKDADGVITCMFQNSFFRNNLFMGSTDAFDMFTCGTINGQPPVNSVNDWDYNAYRRGVGYAFVDWFNIKKYYTLLQLFAEQGVEGHGVVASYADLVDPIPPALYGEPAQTVDDFDFTLQPGAPEIDAGDVLPNINDPFVFDGMPDIGANEFGQPRPKYGPRPIGDVDLDFDVDDADKVAVRNTLDEPAALHPRSDVFIDGQIDVKDLLFVRNRALGVAGGSAAGTASASLNLRLAAPDGSSVVRVLPGRTFQVHLLADITNQNLAALDYQLEASDAMTMTARSYTAPLSYIATQDGGTDLPVLLGTWREVAVSDSPDSGDGIAPGAQVLVGVLTLEAPAADEATLSITQADAAYTSQRYPDGQTFEQITTGGALTIRLRLIGDVDQDDDVDVFDAIAIVNAFGSTPGDPNWNENADFDGNGQVDVFDVIGLVDNFGQSI